MRRTFRFERKNRIVHCGSRGLRFDHYDDQCHTRNIECNGDATFIHKSRTRWDAVVARDARRDGEFVFAVSSTGVYCRPSCAARRPRRENVQFFARPQDAEQAGYRACLRCRPKAFQGDSEAHEIKKICRFIEQNLDEPLTLDRLRKRISTESIPLAAEVQVCARNNAERVCRFLPLAIFETEPAGWGFGNSRDVRRGLRVEQPALRAHGFATWHDSG